MSNYTNPARKISRRLNYSLSETGKELVKKSNFAAKKKRRGGKPSNYKLQLQEKQKIRFTYGISEKQLKRTFQKTMKIKGIHGELFLIHLESRLDNLVYRLNFAVTRAQAKQLVSHGHILVDGKKVDICSYLVKPGQQISLKEKSKNLAFVKEAISSKVNRKFEYVNLDDKKLIGKYVRYPHRNEFLEGIKEQLVVEFYNR